MDELLITGVLHLQSTFLWVAILSSTKFRPSSFSHFGVLGRAERRVDWMGSFSFYICPFIVFPVWGLDLYLINDRLDLQLFMSTTRWCLYIFLFQSFLSRIDLDLKYSCRSFLPLLLFLAVAHSDASLIGSLWDMATIPWARLCSKAAICPLSWTERCALRINPRWCDQRRMEKEVIGRRCISVMGCFTMLITFNGFHRLRAFQSPTWIQLAPGHFFHEDCSCVPQHSSAFLHVASNAKVGIQRVACCKIWKSVGGHFSRREPQVNRIMEA